MKLINNDYANVREINGFNKDEIIDIKKTLIKLRTEKADKEEIDNYLDSIFSSEILLKYSDYIHEIKEFIDNYLIIAVDNQNKNYVNYYNLKSGVLNEIKLISNNIVNLKLNCRNTRRFFKESTYLDDFLSTIQTITNETEDLITRLETSIQKSEGLYDNIGHIWIEANKIKNLMYKINEFPTKLIKWDDLSELSDFIKSLNLDDLKKRQKKKVIIQTSHFNKVFQFYKNKNDENIEFYSDLIFLLFQIIILFNLGFSF